jgi:SAM-dependent methyltransferase
MAFDKYYYYTHSVQNAEVDADFLKKIWKKHGPARPSGVLCEDFCGTAALCYEWVKLSPNHTAVGIDLEDEALRWGSKHHAPNGAPKVRLLKANVLAPTKIKADFVCAFNFSYSVFFTRAELKSYFMSARKRLRPDGLFVLDSFGGPHYQNPVIDKHSRPGFKYEWEIVSFDGLTHRSKCRLNFQPRGKPLRKGVFTYDWRLWSLPEIVDLLEEVGFKKPIFYGEGLDKNGNGDGVFKPIKKETNSLISWVCYLVTSPK